MLTRVWTGLVATDWPLSGDTPAGSDAGVPGDWGTADDLTLVRACLAGHRSAFDPIVERHCRRVYQVCYRFAANHADASDLAQETFIRAFRGLHGFKGNASLATWLYRIAVNVCLNRAAVKTPPRSEVLESRATGGSVELPDAALLRGERAAAVRAAIAQLPKKQRATLILRVYHDLRHDEIATILGSSVGTVKANFFHALANLKKLLK
jgi:RNA polymerase sigma-70 factor (ECF subfamily)